MWISLLKKTTKQNRSRLPTWAHSSPHVTRLCNPKGQELHQSHLTQTGLECIFQIPGLQICLTMLGLQKKTKQKKTKNQKTTLLFIFNYLVLVLLRQCLIVSQVGWNSPYKSRVASNLQFSLTVSASWMLGLQMGATIPHLYLAF